ncbi:MAG: hypothetical protein DI530_08495 [Sphingomonas sp.]|mgnify:CR=1 FL=1|uniref:hypothetical protein n=1 Tax=Sphingomonas sp. TaxID=28214 RepID=UPI000DBC3578|nr:hypothetical protein [Sphingomonas sp.]PZU79624.1 MAG: hypothetical protein DI530_08495 [Sphingomonas sp.]
MQPWAIIIESACLRLKRVLAVLVLLCSVSLSPLHQIGDVGQHLGDVAVHAVAVAYGGDDRSPDQRSLPDVHSSLHGQALPQTPTSLTPPVRLAMSWSDATTDHPSGDRIVELIRPPRG